MKKILLSLSVILTTGAVSAQADTLTEFFTGTPTYYTVPAADGGGYVSGNNGYGDLAKMQLFDATYGVTGGGVITNVLLWAPIKKDNGGSYMVKIWEDNAGEPGAELGSQTITLAATDTSLAGYALAQTVAYNVNATFNVQVPANQKFWAGVVLPATAGDTLVLVTNTDGNFTAAPTHTGEFQSTGNFFSFNDGTNATWGLDIALGVFPVISFGATVGLNSDNINVSVYPNPANDVLNVKLSEVAESVSIISMDGKVVSTQIVNGTSTTVDVSELTSGVYLYEVVTANGTVRNTFMKK